ncbi:hypothetical protein MES5069_70356 [Mesorhizobium escarrei]|uniref:Uncharacterized protein n=1 Tax=Mesorhizobium escarrei TaxID=666018 RepID=A0ABM9EH96_9HYPH|nr:hypothetical protein MES5069_70356 [Mesorhizobium escarrei]
MQGRPRRGARNDIVLARGVLMHVAQKHPLGLEPRVRSGFAITTCMKTKKPKARRMKPRRALDRRVNPHDR